MKKTALDRDAYSRIIARCTAGGIDVNAAPIDEGFAWAVTKYSLDFVDREAVAQAARRGICQGEAPPALEYRADRWSRAASASLRAGCPIKNSINRKRERIFHIPWSPYCERTRIDESAGNDGFAIRQECSRRAGGRRGGGEECRHKLAGGGWATGGPCPLL